MAELKITSENFEKEVYFSNRPVLIDFWAPWCTPCRLLAPVISQIAEEFDGRLKVCKIDVDEEPEIAAKFSVRSIPLVVLLVDGKVATSAIGFRSKEDLIETLGLKAATFRYLDDEYFEN